MAWFHHQLSAGCRGFLELSKFGFLHPRVLWQASPRLDQACNGSDCIAQEFCSAAGAVVHRLRLSSPSASWLHGLVGVGGAQGCEHLGTQARSPSLPLRDDSLLGTGALGKMERSCLGRPGPCQDPQGEGEDRVVRRSHHIRSRFPRDPFSFCGLWGLGFLPYSGQLRSVPPALSMSPCGPPKPCSWPQGSEWTDTQVEAVRMAEVEWGSCLAGARVGACRLPSML